MMLAGGRFEVSSVDAGLGWGEVVFAMLLTPHRHQICLDSTAQQLSTHGMSLSEAALDSHAKKFQLPELCWPVHMGTASTSLRPPFDSM